MTTIDQFTPLYGKMQHWEVEKAKLAKLYPEWIVSYNTENQCYCALNFKYLDLGWVYGRIPAELAYRIEEIQQKEVPWDCEKPTYPTRPPLHEAPVVRTREQPINAGQHMPSPVLDGRAYVPTVHKRKLSRWRKAA